MQREKLEEELDIVVDDLDVQGDVIGDERLQSLMEIHIRIKRIRAEMEVFENPLTRKALLRQENISQAQYRDLTPYHWVILNTGTADDFLSFSKKLKELYPEKMLKFSGELPTILDGVKCNDTVIISPHEYKLKSIVRLECGGTIKGIAKVEDTKIVSSNNEIMFDCSGDVTFENLTFDCTLPQCGIIARRGKLKMINCRLFSNSESSIHQGIVVLDGCELILMGTKICGFYIGLAGMPGSRIEIENSEIYGSSIGIKMFDECKLAVQDSDIRNCKGAGMYLETKTQVYKEMTFDEFEKKV